ncbi:MAG: branched-chain amino acid ABC transporter permease [Anaerolineales bacterium]|jgi:branched-subunit amino acid ABC-type transport system permease component|nr:branched-chain amino acid ABC transporter permease [Anaerolineales bacterium]
MQYLVDGLLIGFVYGIAAMGMSLIWGVMDVINLAHGMLITLGSFGVYYLLTITGLNPYLATLIAGGIGLVAGFGIFKLAIQRVLHTSSLSTLLATFSVNMILVGLSTQFFSTNPRALDINLGSLTIGNLTVQVTRLIASLASILIAGGLWFFLARSRPGKYIRAITNNRNAAELMGINSQQMLAFSFGIGCMLAILSGGLIATIFPFTVLSGDSYQLKSFVIVVLGGLGNPFGALLGGLIIGIFEGVLPAFMKSSWVPVYEFLLFIIILIVKPNGIFGVKK